MPSGSALLYPPAEAGRAAEVPEVTSPEAGLERLVPLVNYLAAWENLPNVSQCVLHIIQQGYRIQFSVCPPHFNRVLYTEVCPEQALVMEQEVKSLLCKDAIETVPPHEVESGFYSRYFIVSKKDGGFRRILDLRLLNQTLKRLKFKSDVETSQIQDGHFETL